MNTIRGLRNGVGWFSWSTEARHGREGAAGGNRDSDVFRRTWDHFRGKIGDVDALCLVLVGSGDDLVDC